MIELTIDDDQLNVLKTVVNLILFAFCCICCIVALLHLVNCFEFLYTVFVQGLLYLGILCCQVFVIVHVVFIQSYGLGGEHYCMSICDRPHTYYSLRNS